MARLGIAATAVAYVCARLWMFWPARAGVGASRYGDSVEYLRVSHLSLFSTRFFTDQKPFGYPLVLNLVEGNQSLVVWLQLAASMVCWCVLAGVVARRVPGAHLRWFAAGTVLLFSASWPVAQWDTVVLTESLSLSVLAVLVALALAFVGRPRRRVAGALLGVALFFTALRDANGAIAAIVLGAVALSLVARKRHVGAVLLLGAAAACIVLVSTTSSVRRWEILVADQIGKRVLADPGELAYFRAHGMPVPQGLSSIIFADTRGVLPAVTFQRDPRLARFMPWFRSEARPTFDGYLLSHPATSLGVPLEQLPVLVSDSGLATYRAPGFRTLPRVLEELVYPSSGGRILWLEVALLGVAAIGAIRRVGQASWAVPLGLAASTVPLAILVWDGEPSEVARHGLLVGVGARLGLWLGLWLIASRVASSIWQASAEPHGRRHRHRQPDRAAL